mmetsp:Transcript_34074/g.55185  ORF Transcript_34074/g.55185 Transcript_34074/m.55185 type:complete len:335 (-) Transcript_34074:65-1069(-)|eukprot:CAMPEP_0184658232 /NCGR_PEP_ID=MMETSP0308-20130426/24356_1 /TAXON_ID=38269 /ORGANISM="Gloeochaete witrockiana, Strain SAG 46.84" /LENGTH=334 /DNA_ID=CAMNT_0027097039 /DNA_START=30 /DNA_END=1034 /DNA_ORIENTATION=+
MTKARTRKLGQSAETVSAMGLGCMPMSGSYNVPEINEEESLRVLNLALDKGINFWDTANVYGKDGANEILLSKVLKHRRDDIFIATKFGISSLLGTTYTVDGRPEYVHKCMDESLKRLGVSSVDLYYQHRVDPNTPVEVTVQAMRDLVKAGKTRYLGLSECSAATLRKAHAIHPISAVQVEYSPWSRDIEHNDLLKTARELGVTVVAFSPLGRGFLTGQLKKASDLPDGDFRKGLPRFADEHMEKNFSLVEALQGLATEKGITVPQLVLAWVLAQGEDIIPIPGTKRSKYFLDNVQALDVNLTPGDLKAMEQILVENPVSGMRFSDALMAFVNI